MRIWGWLFIPYFSIGGWPSGCPSTSGYLSCTQWPGLPEASSSPDLKLWLAQSHLLEHFYLVFLTGEHVFVWCSHSRLCPKDVKRRTTQSFRRHRHPGVRTGSPSQRHKMLCWARGSGGLRELGQSWRSETQASSSRAGTSSGEGGCSGLHKQRNVVCGRMSLLLLKTASLPEIQIFLARFHLFWHTTYP